MTPGTLWLGGLAMAAVVAGAVPPQAPDRQTSQAAGSLVSAETCARCHREIHRYWKASQHAQAAESRLFQSELQHASERGGTPAERLCLACHAPAAVHMQDFALERKASWEGVTCDFCHSVQRVIPGTVLSFVLDVGQVKTGPLRDAKPVGHLSRYAEVHTTSSICAPCHQFINPKGFEVLGTYAEWQGSTYAAKNVTCQSCHMRASRGNVVDPRVTRSAHSVVNLHEMPGGHSVNEINRALLATVRASRNGDELAVRVEVTNRGAAHRVPTGSPLRAIVLLIEAQGGIGSRETAMRTFGRVVVDDEGRELVSEADVWLTGAKTIRDDRLAPGERRVETVSFRMPRQTPVRVFARLFYRYRPEVVDRAEPGVPILTVSTWLDAETR